MTENRTPQERLEEELKQEEHEHHHVTAAALTVHIISNIHTLHVKLHQYHWYVKGPNFFALHAKFEELYNENEEWFDKLAERLLASGNRPPSTTEQFLKYATTSENAADKYIPADKMVEKLIEDYRATRGLTTRAITLAGEEGDAVLEDTLISYKDYVDTTIWMLQAFLGKEALEDDDEFEDDDE